MNDQKRSSTHQGYEEDVANPGAPPSHSTEPQSEGGDETTKTQTDPQTGAPTAGRPDTAGAG